MNPCYHSSIGVFINSSPGRAAFGRRRWLDSFQNHQDVQWQRITYIYIYEKFHVLLPCSLTGVYTLED